MNIPNLLSLSRLLFFLPLLWLLALQGLTVILGLVLAVALCTDMLDGHLARRLGQVTALGAKLDSLADNSILLSACIWLLMLRPEVVSGRQGLVFCLSVLLWLALGVVGWLRFRRIANLHLYSDKIAAIIGGVFLVVSFVSGFHPGLFYLAAGMSMVANAEGIVLLLTHDRVDEHMGSIFAVRDKMYFKDLAQRGSL